jgi:hypothetical protein
MRVRTRGFIAIKMVFVSLLETDHKSVRQFRYFSVSQVLLNFSNTDTHKPIT